MIGELGHTAKKFTWPYGQKRSQARAPHKYLALDSHLLPVTSGSNEMYQKKQKKYFTIKLMTC